MIGRHLFSFERLFSVIIMIAYPFVIVTRGIDVVRNKIKMFAQRKVTLPVDKRSLSLMKPTA